MLQGQRDLVLRPSKRKAGVNLGIIAVVGPILAATAVFELGRGSAVVIAAVSAVLFVVAIGDAYRSRIVLTSQELIVRGLFRGQRQSRTSVARVVRAVVLQGPRNVPNEILFVLDAQDDLLAKVYSGHYYAREDVDRLVSALGVPCDDLEKAVSAEEFAKIYPSLASWDTRRPALITITVLGVVIAVTLALFLIFIARTT
ncbi:hypothetical protein AB0L06_08800 [Spirillospora sp. NPDC052269]